MAPAVKGLILVVLNWLFELEHLPLKALKYFCISHGDRRFLKFEIIINIFTDLPASIEYLMLWAKAIRIIFTFAAGMDFRRQKSLSML